MTPEQLKYSILKVAFSGKLIEPDADSKLPKVKVVDFEETPFDIPEIWIWSTLGNCCEMFTGNSISESVKKTKYTGISDGLDYIATKDVTFENSIIYENGVRIPLSDGFRIAKAGSVLMCIEGGSAGRKIGIIDRDVCFGNKLCMFNSAVIVNKYIFYYLQSNEFKKFFTGNMSGIIGGVSIKKLKELPIPVPPINEQNCIVEKIEALLPVVDRYAVAYEKLEKFNAQFPKDMKKSILQYAIQGKLVEQRAEDGTGEELYQQIQAEKQKLIKDGKIKKGKPLADIADDEIPFDIPGSWKWCRLSDIIDVRDGTHDSPKYVPEGIPLVTSKNLSNGSIDYGNVKYITQEDADKINARSMVDDDDILFAMIGSIGNPVLVKKDREFCIKNMALFKRYANTDISMQYMYWFFFFTQYKLKKEASGGVQSFISLSRFREYLVPLPPYEEQKRIVAKIEELLPLCERLK